MKLRREWLTNAYFAERTRFFTLGSMISNFGFGVAKIVIGAVEASIYLGVNGFYNIVLCAAKLYGLGQYSRLGRTEGEEARGKLVARCCLGMSLCAALASFLYLCFGVTSLFLEDHASYGVPMACFIAASAFSKLIFNWIGAVRMREEHRGIIHQIKLLNVVDGLVAIALTQRALLNLEATPNVSFYCGLGEIVFGIAALLVSLLMVRRARGGEKKFIKS